MPNHLHGIVVICEPYVPEDKIPGEDIWASGDPSLWGHGGAPRQTLDSTERLGEDPRSIDQTPIRAHGSTPRQLQRRAHSIGSFVAGFKAAATKRINIHRNAPGIPVWQRNYYERIIRDDWALECIQRYIRNNPTAWHRDSLNSIHQAARKS